MHLCLNIEFLFTKALMVDNTTSEQKHHRYTQPRSKLLLSPGYTNRKQALGMMLTYIIFIIYIHNTKMEIHFYACSALSLLLTKSKMNNSRDRLKFLVGCLIIYSPLDTLLHDG